MGDLPGQGGKRRPGILPARAPLVESNPMLPWQAGFLISLLINILMLYLLPAR